MLRRPRLGQGLLILRRWKSASKKTTIAPAGPKGPPLPPLEPIEPRRGPRTMLHYIHDMQRRYPEAVVMAQVGSFMELYFEQAVKYGPLLNLKVARKTNRSPIDGHSFVNMAGFPLSQKEKYERLIVQDLGKTVVTLMQNSKYVLDGGSEEEKRPVSRVLTPGTLLAEDFVDKSVNNYLASVHFSGPREACVAWVDIASGKTRYQIVAPADLGNTLARIAPSEVLVDTQATAANSEFAKETVLQYAPSSVFSRTKFPPLEYWSVRANHSQRYRIDELPLPVRKAFVGLVRYVDDCMPGSPVDIQEPELFVGAMQLDARARDALEISWKSSPSSPTPSRQGSLLSIIRRTRSPSGSRLLQDWIAAPLQSPESIRERQDKVQFFIYLPRTVISILQSLLSELPDGARLLQKLRLQKIDPLDLVAFAKSVRTLKNIADVLLPLENVPEDWRSTLETIPVEPLETAEHILAAIKMDALVAGSELGAAEGSEDVLGTGSDVVEPSEPEKKARKPAKSPRKQPKASSSHTFAPATNRDYQPILNAAVSPRLEAIYKRQSGFARREATILSRLQKLYGPTAQLRWSPAHQFHVHLTLNGQNEPASTHLIARNKTTAYLSDADWAKLGHERLVISNQLREEEERVFEELRNKILEDHLSDMRKLYNLADEIDVQLSFAVLAVEKRLVRPEVVDDPSVFEIEQGRHITVETGLALGGYAASGFVPNDCSLSAPQSMCMITGPNMGGKSTYIRQSALIALLAHTGSYVPARRARLGIVDRIFCRLGAGDDLYSGRSTFMMEMLETATILNNATDRSLAILDEVGRGTSGRDGIAIAFASIKHLVLEKHCRTLFATHYGQEIWDLLRESDRDTQVTNGISLLQASLRVDRHGRPVFDYKLKQGISSSSGGLLIAEMAGFPAAALGDARKLIASKS